MPNKTDRPKVGPADPETRRKALRKVLDDEAAAGEQRRADEANERVKNRGKKKPAGNGTTLGGLLDPKKARDRTVEGKDETIMDAVNRGVEMGTAEDKKAAPKPRKRVVSE